MRIVVMSRYGQQQADCQDNHLSAAKTLTDMVSGMNPETSIDVFVFAKGHDAAVYGIRASSATEYLRQLTR